MERGLLIVSLVLGLVLGAIGLAPPRKSVPFPWRASLPGVGAFLLTLPQTGWFAPGQALGIGLLVGTVLGLLAGWLCLQEKARAALGLVAVGIALVGLTTTLFPVDLLLGIALGYLVTQCLLAILYPSAVDSLTLSSGVAVAALAAAALGTYRTNGGAIAPWLVLPSVLIALGGLFTTVTERFLPLERRFVACLGLAVLFVLVLRPLLLPLNVIAWALAGCAGGGVLLAALLDAQGKGESAERRGLGALLTLGSVLLAAHLGQGLGVALLAIGLGMGAAVCGSLTTLALPLTLAVLTALWRLFAQRWTGVRTIALHEQYLLLGLLLGGLLPTLAGGLAAKYASWAGVLKSGAVLLSLPFIATVLYGPSAALALLLGMLAATLWRIAAEVPVPSAAPLFSLSVATALTQLMGHLEPLADGTRLARLKLSGLALLIALAVFFGSRLLKKKKP